jgi:uncharacterized protein (TIGR03790 family)
MKPIISLCILLGFAAAARGELAPDQVGILGMAASRESRYLAEYYAKARGIPASNIFLLRGVPVENLSRKEWDDRVRPELVAWMMENDRESKIRCLVTCWDVPLRINPRGDTAPAVIARKTALLRAREARVKQVVSLLDLIDAVAAPTASSPRTPLDPKTPVATLAELVEKALRAARQRILALSSADERKKAEQTFDKLFLASGGIGSLLASAARKGEELKLPPETARRLELAQAELIGIQKGLQALSVLPDSVARDNQILVLLQQANGILATLQWIDEQQQLLAKNETHAAFDSELSLLLWHDYPLFFWTPNTLYYGLDALTSKLPTLMVCRLAAPKLELVTKLIDTSIAVEKIGLEGKVYLDARGMGYSPNQDKPGSYAQYDQSLRDLSERLLNHTKLEVFLNNEDRLFQPGSCPDAAIYCGWYSLGSYVDAFTWKPGAVGYHMASLEAADLRDPGAKTWCPSMLADGVAATLGPVSEPYLAAFPLPDDFFSLLLTGRYTLAETYYRTSPFNSWQMILIGDPLYNPFKNRPLLKEEHLPERLRGKK